MNPGAAVAESEAIATLDGTTIDREQVEQRVASKLYRLNWEIYDTLKSESEELANEMLLAEEAKRRNMTVDELLRVEVDDKCHPSTDEEIDRYIQENDAAKIAGGDIRARISRYLTEHAKIQRRLDFLKELREKSSFEFLLMPPERPRIQISVEGDPMRGNPDAPVTIVHFASFTCDICAESAHKIQKLTEEFPGLIRWVHRDFINLFDEHGLAYAEAGETARANGKFWEFHDYVYSLADDAEEGEIGKVFSHIGIDVSNYEQAHTNATYLMEIKRDIEDGVTAGVSSVPVIFINGRYVSGTFPYETLRGMVEEELQSIRSVSGKKAGTSP